MKLADALRDDYRFAHINNADVLAETGKEGKIVLQRPRAMKNKFEDSDVEFPGEKFTGEFYMNHTLYIIVYTVNFTQF